MSDRAIYLDSSAILKLVYTEDETEALKEFLREWPRRTSSVLARVEVMRAARQVGDDLVLRHARDVLDGIDFVLLDPNTIERAARIDPLVRSRDAIHLATALSLEPTVGGLVVYDVRLARAARAAGIEVWAPA